MNVITLKELSYEELTNLHTVVRNKLKEINQKLEPHGKTPLSEITIEVTKLVTERQFYYNFRIMISEHLLNHCDTVKLPKLW